MRREDEEVGRLRVHLCTGHRAELGPSWTR